MTTRLTGSEIEAWVREKATAITRNWDAIAQGHIEDWVESALREAYLLNRAEDKAAEYERGKLDGSYELSPTEQKQVGQAVVAVLSDREATARTAGIREGLEMAAVIVRWLPLDKLNDPARKEVGWCEAGAAAILAKIEEVGK